MAEILDMLSSTLDGVRWLNVSDDGSRRMDRDRTPLNGDVQQCTASFAIGQGGQASKADVDQLQVR